MPNNKNTNRCSEDVNGKLWYQKTKYAKQFKIYFPDLNENNIKEILHLLRGNRCGAFWINRENETITACAGEGPVFSYPSKCYKNYI